MSGKITIDCFLNAVKDNNLATINDYLNNGGDINATDLQYGTALITAAFYNYPELCKLFIDKGANLNAQFENGYTALSFAAAEGNLEVCKILVEAGADIYIINENGRCALLEAAYNDKTIIFSYLNSLR